MEDPKGWDILTASLSVSDLQQPRAAWAFLVVQGLVRDLPEDRETFCRIVQEEQEIGVYTGPSIPQRVAGKLALEGLTLPPSETPDPNAETAQQRRALLQAWRQPPEPVAEAVTRRDLFESTSKRPTDLLPIFCIFCGAPDTDEQRDGVCHHCQRRQPESQAATRGQSCPRCSEINLLIAHFCLMCGHYLSRGCPQCGKALGEHDVFCTNCGARLAPDKPLTEPIVTLQTAPAAPPLTTSRLFRLFAQPANSDQLTQQVGDLRAVLLSVIQDVAVLKEVLHEHALWDEAQYKQLRVKRMVADQSSASASPWLAYSYYPYTLEDEQFLRLCLHASETEIEEFKREVEQTKELT